MTLIDSNIPMYLVGAAHPHKTDAQLLVERAIAAGERLVTDAEVLQEILHRYVSIQRRDAIQAAFDVLLGIVDDVLSVDQVDVERAKIIVHGHQDHSAERLNSGQRSRPSRGRRSSWLRNDDGTCADTP